MPSRKITLSEIESEDIFSHLSPLYGHRYTKFLRMYYLHAYIVTLLKGVSESSYSSIFISRVHNIYYVYKYYMGFNGKISMHVKVC